MRLALTADIIELASQYGRYGYRKITALLRAGLGRSTTSGSSGSGGGRGSKCRRSSRNGPSLAQ